MFMTTMKLSAKGGGDFFRLRFWAAGLLMLGMFLVSGMGEANAATLAGTSIGNQASASYTDSNGVSRVTVSNTVTTTVAQVAGITLTQNQTKSGAPGQPLSFPHTITNTGNGSDSYNLTVSAPTGTSISGTPQIFADANCDGIADNTTTITSVGPVAAGAQACFVVQATVATAGSGTGNFVVTATSSTPGIANAGATASNTDTVNITTAGVVNVSKSISLSSGTSPTDKVVYTLTYRNTGSQPVFGLVIADTLQTGVAFSTTDGLKATLNGTQIAATVAAVDGAVHGSTPNRYNLSLSSNQRSIVLVIEEVPANTQGTFTFQTTQTGPGPINNNNAQFCYLDGSNQSTNPYSPGGTGANLPTTIQPPATGGTSAIGTSCKSIIGDGTSAGTTAGSGVLSTGGGSAATNYTTATSGVIDTNVANATSATNPNVTNTVPFTILTAAASGALVLNDGTSAAGGNNGTVVANAGLPTDGGNPTTFPNATDTPDVNIVASATQGSVVTFSNWVWNTGTASDTYNVTAIANNFPAGTTFLYFRSDGATPLTDSDGDGNPDTGPIPGTGTGATCPANSGAVVRPNVTASATTPCAVRVVVAAQLPSNATGTNLEVIVRAASSLTPATTNTVSDKLSAIVGSSVDLRNPRTVSLDYSNGTGGTFTVPCSSHDLAPNQGTCDLYTATGTTTNGGGGQTTAGEGTAQTFIAANPATQVTFKIDVNNTGAIADSFNLAYNLGSGAWTFNGSTNSFNTPAQLPAGYTLGFYFDGGNNNCSTLAGAGAQITNTGVIAPAGHKLVCAVVAIPAGATGGVNDLYFRVLSPTTTTANAGGNSVDVLHDQLVINTVRSVTVTPNNSGQVFPGGSVAYCHTVTNAGNVTESSVKLTDLNSLTSPWSTNSTLYLDTNNNCTLDGTESATPIDGGVGATFSLTAGATVKYIVVVQAPAAATAGQTNVTTVTATPSTVVSGVNPPAASNATDTTVVVTGQVNLVKTQILDPTGTACSTGMNSAALSALAFSSAAITSNAAIPGACIIYHVVATNVGTQNVTQVIISDATPPNTTCLGTPFSTNGGTVNVTPATACVLATTASASVATTSVTLIPNATVDLYLRVRINP
jgi:uncharacterized repeat protein (TIGR01451 family)